MIGQRLLRVESRPECRGAGPLACQALSPRAVEAVLPKLPFSALLAGSNHDGSTVEGIRDLL